MHLIFFWKSNDITHVMQREHQFQSQILHEQLNHLLCSCQWFSGMPPDDSTNILEFLNTFPNFLLDSHVSQTVAVKRSCCNERGEGMIDEVSDRCCSMFNMRCWLASSLAGLGWEQPRRQTECSDAGHILSMKARVSSEIWGGPGCRSLRQGTDNRKHWKVYKNGRRAN